MDCFRAGIDGLGELQNCGMYEPSSIAAFPFVTSLPARTHLCSLYIHIYTHLFVVQTDVEDQQLGPIGFCKLPVGRECFLRKPQRFSHFHWNRSRKRHPSIFIDLQDAPRYVLMVADESMHNDPHIAELVFYSAMLSTKRKTWHPHATLVAGYGAEVSGIFVVFCSL